METENSIADETLLEKGHFTIDKIDESGIRFLEFNPPLNIDWSFYPNSMPGGRECFVDYDFGLTDRFRPYASIAMGWSYDDITMKTPISEVVKAFVKYELFHAFFHYQGDPNYSHLHWALSGHLKDRVKIIDNEDAV
jgi:hypothetical protein